MNRKRNALIVGQGDDVPATSPPIDSSTLVICADGGSKHVLNWKLQPDFIIGDLDSITDSEREYWSKIGVEIRKFPVEKDKTDVELAVDYCLGRGVHQITLTGVWGGRIDHSLGNLEILYALASRDVRGELLTSNSYLVTVGRHLILDVEKNTIVSLIPLSAQVTGVTTSGLYYSLDNATLARGTTRGISNYALRPQVEIRVDRGYLLAVVNGVKK